ncbi:MAG: ThiF family adenylyltransferase [Flavisolibacter sp.]
MRPTLVGHSPDLNKLWEEGYTLVIKDNKYLLIHNIPYYSTAKQVKKDGILVMPMELAGDKTVNPLEDHSSYFIGDRPADENGDSFAHIIGDQTQDLAPDIRVNFRFSSKPRDRKDAKYTDYYDKITRYVTLLMSAAYAHDKTVTATGLRVFLPQEENPVFAYADTNSSRAEIETITQKLRGYKIGIVGVGGTGSYVLDFVSKTPVQNINLFDGDYFRNHNAFRAPGAATIETLREHPKKVEYLQSAYSKMHLYVHAYDIFLDGTNANLLEGLDFVFLCMDANESKKQLVDYLIASNKPFIDAGIGILKTTDQLRGHVRTSFVTNETKDHVVSRLPFKTMADQYDHNIQIAELNALNACLAVIKWKKMAGFYTEDGEEFESTYVIKSNKIFNETTRAELYGEDTSGN